MSLFNGSPRVRPETGDTRARLMADLQTVRTAFAKVKTSVQFTELKSVRSRRTIALPAVAIAALRSHRVRQLEARLVAADAGRIAASYSPAQSGRHLSRGT